MQPLAILQSMVLLTVANGAPVVAKRIFGARFSRPLDFGLFFLDGRPLFGPSKTVRGVFVSILISTAGAPLVGLPPKIGTVVAVTAMAGDLFSSFVKRRLNLRPSSQAIGLDQVPESLLPLLACGAALLLTAADIAFGVVVFFVGELIFSRILYWARLRDEPY
jgi:CDP-diglyceride synthetase